MTAFTVNAGGTVEWDSLAGGSTNATLDSYAISENTTLRIACDSYQCANHSTAFGSLDTVTFSGRGGKLQIDGRSVRCIPFNTGAGNVPAIGTTISQGGVSGPLLGVWADWQSEPVAAGAAMPASGFIKVKSVTGGAFAAGALTGISASATGPDVVGWIEVRGADTATITVPRIGTFEVLGEWFELGTTTGARGQVLPCPTTATVAGVFGGVWIETAPGSGVYERFVGVGSMVNSATTPTDTRGKVVWQTTAGIRIGSDGTNNVGFLPPSGCRVRIPNVILTCCTRTVSGSGPRVLPNATLATRQEFVTTNSGDIILDGAVMQWYGNFLQAFGAKVYDSIVNDTLILQEIASPIDVNNVIVSPTQAQLNLALNMVSCFAGGSVVDVSFARFSLATAVNVATVNLVTGVTFTRCRVLTLLNRGNTSATTWGVTQAVNCSWVDCEVIGGKIAAVTCLDCTWSNLTYADVFSGTTGTTVGAFAWECTSGTSRCLFTGFTVLGTNLQPYNGIISLTSCYDCKVRNIGSVAAPLSLGTVNQGNVIFNLGGNNAGHKFQRIYVDNTRTNLWTMANSDEGIVIDRVWGDTADAPVVAALNTLARGCRGTPATTAQTAVYGTHWIDSFISTTAGRLHLLCNEPSAETAAYVYVVAGTPKFNSAGRVALTNVNDEVVFEMPYFMLGHEAFANIAPTLTGTNTGNLTLEFQYQSGTNPTWNGTWLALTGANLSSFLVGFGSIGVKLKIRVRCTVANAGNLLTNVQLNTTTSTTSRDPHGYPLDLVTITLTGLKNPTEIRVYTAGGTTEIAGTGAENVVSGSHAFQVEEGSDVDISVLALGYQNLRVLGYPCDADASIPIFQQIDRQYLNP